MTGRREGETELRIEMDPNFALLLEHAEGFALGVSAASA